MLIEFDKYKEPGKKYAVDPTRIESLNQMLNNDCEYVTVIRTKTGDSVAVAATYSEVVAALSELENVTIQRA